MIRVSPSILSADFGALARDVASIQEAHAEYVHIDVMDGQFVPNISFGFPVIAAIRPASSLVFDVHLMIDRPIRYAERFCQAGADIVTVHVEADTPAHILDTIHAIRACGKKPAVSLKPGTPAEAVFPYAELVDLILVMTVEPGFGGQSFMADMLPKITAIRSYLDAHNPACEIEVDGGISSKNIAEVVKAGANVLVAGSAVFKSEDPAAEVALLQKLGNEAAQEA